MIGNNPLVSVVVPVYNKARYLKKCIESIRNQTYRQLEIILVDDGSTDNSLEVCMRYREMDERIVVIEQENGGPSSARNTGIENAKGEYIAFVDADDELELDAYETLVENLLSVEAELAIVGMRYIYSKDTLDMILPKIKKGVYSRNDILKLYFKEIIVCFSSVNKMYSRRIIGDTRFDLALKMSEDQKFVYEILQKTDKIIYDPKICYNIYFTGESLSRTQTTRYHLAQLDVNEYIIDLLNDEEIKNMARLYNVNLCLSVFVPYYRDGDFLDDDILRIDSTIKENKRLIIESHDKLLKIKLLLYILSPKLLKQVLLYKRKKEDNIV